jgi:glycosyltransferase involved in cell wall biosynthesis
MRAGLFLEGLARCHSVRVLVIPVFGWPDDPGGFVHRHAATFDVLDLAVHRTEALRPLPALSRAATPAAKRKAAAAADGCRAVHVMRLYLAPFMDALLERRTRPPMVLDLDDLESTTHRSLGLADEAERYERLEAHYLPLFDRVLTASSGDAQTIAHRYRLAGAQAVPNAVRPPQTRFEPAGRHDLLLVGNLSYAPNADAACWLCRDVLPLLGDVTVAVVGSRPGPEVCALADDARVTVAADVPEVGPWYAGAQVATAPLRAGGGIPTKVLEAFAHDRPVVTTTQGAAAFDVDQEDGPALIADDPEDFARACRRLLDDPQLATRSAARGAELVRAYSTVDVVATSIDRLFGSIPAR